MRIAWVACALLAVGCGGTDASETLADDEPDAVDETRLAAEVSLAEEAWFEGDYARASRLIDAVFAQIGEGEFANAHLDATAHYVRGLCRSDAGDFEGAISDLSRSRGLNRAASHEQGYASSTTALAAAYDYAGRYTEAEPLFRERVAAAREGDDASALGFALTDLGVNLEFQGRCADATSTLFEAVESLRPSGPSSLALDSANVSLGNCAYRGHRLEDAARHYRHALEARAELEHPRAAIARHNLARVLGELGQRDEALVHAREAVRLRVRALPPEHTWRRESEALFVELGGTLPLEPETPSAGSPAHE